MKKTLLLIFLCIITSLFCWYYGNESLIDLLVFSGTSFFQGRFWTVITALFVHGNLLHLAGNMLFLYVFGSTLENEVGAGKTLSAFFIGGILSFLLSIYFYGPNTIMIGASAAIFTLTATVMLIKPLKFSWAFLMPLGLVAILYLIYNILVVSNIDIIGGGENVAYWSHIIGFIIGIPFGIAWSRGKWGKNLLMAIALLIIYFILITFIGYLLEILLPL